MAYTKRSFQFFTLFHFCYIFTTPGFILSCLNYFPSLLTVFLCPGTAINLILLKWTLNCHLLNLQGLPSSCAITGLLSHPPQSRPPFLVSHITTHKHLNITCHRLLQFSCVSEGALSSSSSFILPSEWNIFWRFSSNISLSRNFLWSPKSGLRSHSPDSIDTQAISLTEQPSKFICRIILLQYELLKDPVCAFVHLCILGTNVYWKKNKWLNIYMNENLYWTTIL